jgi:hypothetical protein
MITAPDERYAAQSAQLLKEIETRKGTRYEQTRRFAVPLHDAEWQPVEFDVFQEESRRAEPFLEKRRKNSRFSISGTSSMTGLKI